MERERYKQEATHKENSLRWGYGVLLQIMKISLKYISLQDHWVLKKKCNDRWWNETKNLRLQRQTSSRNFLFTGNTLTYLYPLEQIFDSAMKSQEKMTLSLKLWDADTKLPAAWNWVKAVLKKTANLIFWARLRKTTLRLAINQFTYPKLIEWIELWNKSKVISLALVYGKPGEWICGSRTGWPPQSQQLGLG